jgi:hypothetical protein
MIVTMTENRVVVEHTKASDPFASRLEAHVGAAVARL